MVLEKRGNPRKSRRMRLPSSSYTGTTRFTPSAEEWERIEKPFGLRFSDEDRGELIDIVEVYFKSEPFERTAPFADDAQAWLVDVRTKAFIRSFVALSRNRLAGPLASTACPSPSGAA